MSFILRVCLVLILMAIPSVLDHLREKRPNNSFLVAVTRYRFVVASVCGAMIVLLTLVLPHFSQPYPPDTFSLQWSHPNEELYPVTREAFHYDWSAGETSKIVEIPPPPTDWRKDPGLVLLYTTHSDIFVVMEDAFGNPALPMSVTTGGSNENSRKIYGIGLLRTQPWSSPEDAHPLVWSNPRVPPFHLLVTREAKE